MDRQAKAPQLRKQFGAMTGKWSSDMTNNTQAMRLAGHAITALALALMAVALTPGGDVYQWAAGITLLFAGAGCGSLADNQALKYGGGVRV